MEYFYAYFVTDFLLILLQCLALLRELETIVTGSKWRAPECNEYRRFAESLHYDFLVVGHRMRSTPTGKMLPYSLPEKALVLDFHLMQFLCAMGRFFWPPMARFALREMIAVLICFAGIADQRMFAEASEWF